MSNERDDRMKFEGEVIESNKGIFKVITDQGNPINCRLTGKLKLNEIKVIVGDWVELEVSPYDLTVGRIVKRLKQSIY